jgi:hypothetical protein
MALCSLYHMYEIDAVRYKPLCSCFAQSSSSPFLWYRSTFSTQNLHDGPAYPEMRSESSPYDTPA